MAKKFDIEDEVGGFDPAISAEKLPTDIKGGKQPRMDYMNVPVSQFIPFRQKGKGDFSRMSQEDFQRMVDSVRDEGILEAVIARQLDDGRFELLAGETRWTAATTAGLESIPARVLVDCDDFRAARVFSITNLNRRKNNLRDWVYGWYVYWENAKTRGKGTTNVVEEDLADFNAAAGNLPKEEIHLRQIQKYYKIYKVLEDDFYDELEKGIISIDGAYALAFLTKAQRNDILDVRLSTKQAEQLKELSQKGKWTKAAVDKIINKKAASKPYEASMKKAVTKFKKTITERLIPSQYNNVDTILEDALALYFEAHPEHMVK